jgi:predicted alpha/beta superfamily hydrolase
MTSPALVLESISKQTLRGIWSPQRRNRRDVDVYLPASYATSRRRYPVVYMHDGQNLSDPKTAFAGTWQLESVLRTVAARGIELIVVGVHNVPDDRLIEYSPFAEPKHDGGEAPRYLAFLIDTLKPRIDRLFRTAPRRTATFGSSMGGLFSLFAALQRPDVFGLAGVMSPSLWFGQEQLFAFVERASVSRTKLYLDVGTAEGATALRDVRALRSLLERKGLQRRESLLYVEDRGGRHDEASWSRRVGKALEWLMANG